MTPKWGCYVIIYIDLYIIIRFTQFRDCLLLQYLMEQDSGLLVARPSLFFSRSDGQTDADWHRHPTRLVGFSGFPRSHGRLTNRGVVSPLFWPFKGKTPKHHMFITLFFHHNYNNLISGWWFQPTPLKNDGVRQLGWWHSQLNGKS